MKHYSPLEFGTVYLKFPNTSLNELDVEKYETNPFSAVTITKDSTRYVTTNYRVIVENRWEDDLKYMCEPTKHHQRRTTVKFITNRAMTHELVRHRSMSFMQEGQRYCNYAKDKFGNQLTFIIPVQCIGDIPNNTELKDDIDINNFVWAKNDNGKTLKVNKLSEGYQVLIGLPSIDRPFTLAADLPWEDFLIFLKKNLKQSSLQSWFRYTLKIKQPNNYGEK